MGDPWSIEAWAKWPGYLALIAGMGAAVTLALPGEARGTALGTKATRLARIAGAVGVVAIMLRAVAHAATIDGLAGAFDLDTLRLVVVDSRWGGSWRWHAATAVTVALASLRLARGRHLAPYALALTAAVIVAPWLGHGAGSVWRGALHSAHLAGTGAWLGTVVVLALVARGTARTEAASSLTPVIARFSPWALACATLAFASGIVLAWTYLGGFAALADTTYGRVLLVKLALVAGIGLCGAINWRGVRQGNAPKAGLIQSEAVLAVLAIAVTAWLSETEHP